MFLHIISTAVLHLVCSWIQARFQATVQVSRSRFASSIQYAKLLCFGVEILCTLTTAHSCRIIGWVASSLPYRWLASTERLVYWFLSGNTVVTQLVGKDSHPLQRLSLLGALYSPASISRCARLVILTKRGARVLSRFVIRGPVVRGLVQDPRATLFTIPGAAPLQPLTSK